MRLKRFFRKEGLPVSKDHLNLLQRICHAPGRHMADYCVGR